MTRPSAGRAEGAAPLVMIAFAGVGFSLQSLIVKFLTRADDAQSPLIASLEGGPDAVARERHVGAFQIIAWRGLFQAIGSCAILSACADVRRGAESDGLVWQGTELPTALPSWARVWRPARPLAPRFSTWRRERGALFCVCGVWHACNRGGFLARFWCGFYTVLARFFGTVLATIF